MFHKFRNDLDDQDCPLTLDSEWLSEEDKARRKQFEIKKKQSTSHIEQLQPEASSPEIHQQQSSATKSHDTEDQFTTTAEQEDYPVTMETEASEPEQSTTLEPKIRRSERTRRPPDWYTFDKQHGYAVIKVYYTQMYSNMLLTHGLEYQNRYLLALLFDQEFGLLENVSPTMLDSTDPPGRCNQGP